MDRVRAVVEADWAWKRNITGKGIGIALLDTGIMPHPDFSERESRILYYRNFAAVDGGRGLASAYSMTDPAGHGTHVAGILCGNGNRSAGRYRGIAPGSHIIMLRVLDEQGDGMLYCVREAVGWLLQHYREYGIRIVNLSFGTAEVQSHVSEELNQLAEKLWNEGLVVIAAAGNSGPAPGSVTAPGSSRKVITVGGEAEGISSGRGPTSECIMKPELIAPVSGIYSCGAVREAGRLRYTYVKRSGTSMAAPMVSGAVALLLENHPQMNNKEVKAKLRQSATNLGLPMERQGWGRLNIHKLLE